MSITSVNVIPSNNGGLFTIVFSVDYKYNNFEPATLNYYDKSENQWIQVTIPYPVINTDNPTALTVIYQLTDNTLVNGTRYSYYVSSLPFGANAVSTISGYFTPSTIPLKPTIQPLGIPGSKTRTSFKVAFTNIQNGGSNIIQYIVYVSDITGNTGTQQFFYANNGTYSQTSISGTLTNNCSFDTLTNVMTVGIDGESISEFTQYSAAGVVINTDGSSPLSDSVIVEPLVTPIAPVLNGKVLSGDSQVSIPLLPQAYFSLFPLVGLAVRFFPSGQTPTEYLTYTRPSFYKITSQNPVLLDNASSESDILALGEPGFVPSSYGINLLIHTLLNNVNYNFDIALIDDDGLGQWYSSSGSGYINATPNAPPSPVENILVSRVSSSEVDGSFKLNWTRPTYNFPDSANNCYLLADITHKDDGIARYKAILAGAAYASSSNGNAKQKLLFTNPILAADEVNILIDDFLGLYATPLAYFSAVTGAYSSLQTYLSANVSIYTTDGFTKAVIDTYFYVMANVITGAAAFTQFADTIGVTTTTTGSGASIAYSLATTLSTGFQANPNIWYPTVGTLMSNLNTLNAGITAAKNAVASFPLLSNFTTLVSSSSGVIYPFISSTGYVTALSSGLGPFLYVPTASLPSGFSSGYATLIDAGNVYNYNLSAPVTVGNNTKFTISNVDASAVLGVGSAGSMKPCYIFASSVTAGQISQMGYILSTACLAAATQVTNWKNGLAAGVVSAANLVLVQTAINNLNTLQSNWNNSAKKYFVAEGYPGVAYDLTIYAAVNNSGSILKSQGAVTVVNPTILPSTVCDAINAWNIPANWATVSGSGNLIVKMNKANNFIDALSNIYFPGFSSLGFFINGAGNVSGSSTIGLDIFDLNGLFQPYPNVFSAWSNSNPLDLTSNKAFTINSGVSTLTFTPVLKDNLTNSNFNGLIQSSPVSVQIYNNPTLSSNFNFYPSVASSIYEQLPAGAASGNLYGTSLSNLASLVINFKNLSQLAPDKWSTYFGSLDKLELSKPGNNVFYNKIMSKINSLSSAQKSQLISDLFALYSIVDSTTSANKEQIGSSGKYNVVLKSIPQVPGNSLNVESLPLDDETELPILSDTIISSGWNLLSQQNPAALWRLGDGLLVNGETYFVASFYRSSVSSTTLFSPINFSTPLLVAALPTINTNTISSSTLIVSPESSSINVSFSKILLLNNGSSVTSVIVSAVEYGASLTNPASSATQVILQTDNPYKMYNVSLTGLTNGVRYNLYLTPVNNIGVCNTPYQLVSTYTPFSPTKITIVPITQVGSSTNTLVLNVVMDGDGIKNLLVIANFMGKSGTDAYLQTFNQADWVMNNDGTNLIVKTNNFDANDGLVVVVIGNSGDTTSAQLVPIN